MATVSEILGKVFDYVGRPTTDKLSLGLVLPFLMDSVQFYGVDVQLSSENWLLKQYVFTPSAKEHPVIVPSEDFSVPVAVELRDADSTSESDWQGVLIANVSDVQEIGRDGTKAVSFFGNPVQVRWSFDPSEVEVECKLWYEPLMEQPSELTSSPKISQAFHSMVAIRTALLCAPHIANAGDQTQLVATLTTQLAQWESKWKLWISLDRNAKPVQKRDFRGIRAGKSWWWF